MYLVSTEDIMADWQIMLRWSMGIFGLAIISFIFHLRTPTPKRSKVMVHPFSFMLLVSTGSLIISILLFFLDK
jgi:hypothetical protein